MHFKIRGVLTRMVFAAVFTLASLKTCMADVLANPGFETDAVLNAAPVAGATGWTSSGNTATASASGSPVRTGIGSLKLTGAGGFGVPLVNQAFAASPGQTWDLSGYMLTPTALPANATFGLLKIVWLNSVGAELPPGTALIGNAANGGNPGVESLPFLNSFSTANVWLFTEAKGVAPAGTAQVKFYALNVDESAGTMYFDDLQASVITPVVVTNGVHSTIASGNQVSWTASSANSYQPQKSANNSTWVNLGSLLSGSAVTAVLDAAPVPFYRVQEISSGLLESDVNGGFELVNGAGGATNWATLGDQPPTRITADFHTGSASMSLYVTNTTGAPGKSELQQNVANEGGSVVSGNSYTFSFWAKQNGSGVSYVQTYRVTWRDSGNLDLPAPTASSFAGGSGVWTQISRGPLVAPANAVSAFIQIYGETGAVANGFGGVLIDDVSLSTGGGAATTNVLAATVLPGVQISWPSTNGLSYYVQSAANLSANPAWSAFGGVVIGNGATNTANDSASAAQKYYQVLQIQ